MLRRESDARNTFWKPGINIADRDKVGRLNARGRNRIRVVIAGRKKDKMHIQVCAENVSHTAIA